MSNDVQSHEDVAERVAGEERRASGRHTARSLGSVTARIIGGSQVDLVNFSNRGVLFECDSRLLIGARASVRITTTDANLIVTGRVVRSRVKGLVNGALRYDAALVLDTELGLVPKFPDSPAASGDGADADDLVAFESELDATFDPSPVEAYLAESEASLLEVANGSDLQHHAPESAEVVVDTDFDVPPEPPPIPELASPAIDTAAVEVADEPEPVAFEADAEIAFEPAVEFAFDDAGGPSFDDAALASVHDDAAAVAVEPVELAAADDPAGTSMFDATYMPPAADDVAPALSQFHVTPPTSVPDSTSGSLFDARPSESYGEPPAEAAEAAEAAVAFEAEDGVLFEEAFDIGPADHHAIDAQAGDHSPTADACAPPALPDEALDAPIDSPAAVSDTDDRVLLQFAATVPHDLAELRRIAADNQW